MGPIKKFTATYENIQILSEKNRKEVLTAEVWPFRLPSILFAACSAGTCSTKTALQQSVFLLLRLASSATIRECQNTFGTATFRIRKTNAFITLGKKLKLHLFCSKTAPPASQRLEKICTSVQLDRSRSELPHKQSSNPHPPQHTGGAPQPLRQQPRIYGFLIQQRIQKCNHQKACHTATNGLESVRPRSQPC